MATLHYRMERFFGQVVKAVIQLLFDKILQSVSFNLIAHFWDFGQLIGDSFTRTSLPGLQCKAWSRVRSLQSVQFECRKTHDGHWLFELTIF